MTEFQKRMIILLAQKNMRISDVSRKAGMPRSQVETTFEHIKEETGLNPWNFFDLHELYQMATSEVSE